MIFIGQQKIRNINPSRIQFINMSEWMGDMALLKISGPLQKEESNYFTPTHAHTYHPKERVKAGRERSKRVKQGS